MVCPIAGAVAAAPPNNEGGAADEGTPKEKLGVGAGEPGAEEAEGAAPKVNPVEAGAAEEGVAPKVKPVEVGAGEGGAGEGEGEKPPKDPPTGA